jgi:hypothetical protein
LNNVDLINESTIASLPIVSNVSTESNTVQDKQTPMPSSPAKRKRHSNVPDANMGQKKIRSLNTSSSRKHNDENSDGSDDLGVDLAGDRNRTAPSFDGRRISRTENTPSLSSLHENHLLEELHFQQTKLESRYLQPLILASQRQSEILREVVEKQQKIIRGLRRRSVSEQEGLCRFSPCILRFTSSLQKKNETRPSAKTSRKKW